VIDGVFETVDLLIHHIGIYFCGLCILYIMCVYIGMDDCLKS
jgi:hypothetical protein